MKSFLLGLLGANRPKIIAVFATTRAEAERAVAHARTAGTDLPIWVWCADTQGDSGPVEGCERFAWRDLRTVWPALSIVAWTGRPAPVSMKVLPLLRPPFRVVLFNEAGGFFLARPGMIASHAKRRMHDRIAGSAQLTAQWTGGALQWTGSRLWDAAQWVFWRAFHAGLGISRFLLLVASFVLLLWSLLWRGGERIRDCVNWLFALVFAWLALAAQPLAPLSYALVNRARQRRTERSASAYSVEQEPSSDGSFTEVALPNRGWPRRALMAAVRSDAEFIVLRKRGELASAAPLIAMAVETRAFAVARQLAWSAWRKRVVARHPFRRLQEGEVSEVFAPYSSLMAIRRSTLLRLGVPRGVTAGAALTLLFWRASAAGLRSLVAGHGDVVTDEPAMALEDVETAVRLTLSSSLAGLGPERPARFRGNVAWSPAHSRGFRRSAGLRKPRVLVVSPYLPFPLSHGGAVRIYNICKSLADRVDFVLASFHEANETICYDELHEVFREVHVVDVDEKHADRQVSEAAAPKQVVEYRNAAMSDLIQTLCRERAVDIVQLEFTQMAEYREDTGAVPVILVEHDITFTLYSQLADFNRKPETRREFERWREFERQALQCSNLVWTMSRDERQVALEHGARSQHTHVIANGVDVERFEPTTKPAGGPPVVLFVGSFRHLPNLLAYESLRTMIMPAVWRACPEAVLHVIAGPRHEKAAELAGRLALLEAHPQVVVEGFVTDVRPAYRSADVVAVSLPLSAGTNIKLLEAMACGRAIVSTTSGCRGLGLTSGVELIVAELDASFPSAIVTLLRDGEMRQKMAVAARKTAERRFAWTAIADEAMGSYLELAPKAGARPRVPVRAASAQHA